MFNTYFAWPGPIGSTQTPVFSAAAPQLLSSAACQAKILKHQVSTISLCPSFSREVSACDAQALGICWNDQGNEERRELEEVQKDKIDFYKIGHGIILRSKVKNLRGSRRQWERRDSRKWGQEQS